jgi:hypothetical protein
MLRKIVIGTAIGTVLAMALVGCTPSAKNADQANGKAKASASPTPSPSPKPAELLAAAVAKTSAVDFKLVLAGEKAEENVNGAYHSTGPIASFNSKSADGELDVLVTAEDIYLGKVPSLKGKYMRMQMGKLPAKNAMAVFADPAGALTLLSAVTEVQSTTPGSFSGTVDLAKAQPTTTGGKTFVAFMVQRAGTKGGAPKFTATVDPQGYVSKASITLPDATNGGDFSYEVTLSDFGTPVALTAPAAKLVVEAPAASYDA